MVMILRKLQEYSGQSKITKEHKTYDIDLRPLCERCYSRATAMYTTPDGKGCDLCDKCAAIETSIEADVNHLNNDLR